MTTEEGERPTSILKWSTRHLPAVPIKMWTCFSWKSNTGPDKNSTIILLYYIWRACFFKKKKTYLMIFDDDKIIKIFKNYKNIVKGENPHNHTTQRQQLFIVCTVFLWIQSPRQGGRCRAVTAVIHCLLITQHGTCGQLERPRCATQLTLLST